MGGLPGTDRDLPARQLFFEVAQDACRVAGDDELFVVDLFRDAALLDEGADRIGDELTRGGVRVVVRKIRRQKVLEAQLGKVETPS